MNNWKIILTELVKEFSVSSCTEFADGELKNGASKELHTSIVILVQAPGPLGQCVMFNTNSFPWQ